MNNKPPKLTLKEAAEMAVNVLEHLGYDPVDLREALAKEDSLPDDCEWIDGATPPEGERMRIQANGETWFVKNGRYYRCTAEHKPEPIVIRTTAPVTYNEGTKYAITFNAQGE